jgi:hypothetical protein
VRIFGEIDPEWEVDPKSIVFQEKVRVVCVETQALWWVWWFGL